MRDLPSVPVSVLGHVAAELCAVSVGVSLWTVVAGAQGASDTLTPTPLEQALMEHNCRVPGQAMLPADLQEVCLRDQLTYLRAEFGRDLRKLPAADRRTIDRACSALRVERGRDEYIACLADRLTRVTKARGRAVPGVPSTAAALARDAGSPGVGSGSLETPGADTTAWDPPPVETPATASGGSLGRWLGGLIVLLSGAGAWGLIARRRVSKPALVFCRVCGEVAQAGDLCATCRHEAAEAQRRASAERAEPTASTPDDRVHRPEASAGEVPRAEATTTTTPSRESASAATTEAPPATQAQVLEARRREQEEALRARIERERQEAHAQEAERRRWQEAAVAAIAAESPIDPRTVLGVSADATPEEIRSAYEQAKQKYSPDLVSHLGSELQELYRTKAQAVERAYEFLRHQS
ncbi:MAG: hypothetical protein FJW27_19405 [Acidimicrobiia bacterium]|nr:hypothetical protein [Acidimicrobiia bacterium]